MACGRGDAGGLSHISGCSHDTIVPSFRRHSSNSALMSMTMIELEELLNVDSTITSSSSTTSLMDLVVDGDRPFAMLPEEVAIMVMQNLPPRDIAKYRRVSRQWNRFICANYRYLPKRPIPSVYVYHIIGSRYRFMYDYERHDSIDVDLCNMHPLPTSMSFNGISFERIDITDEMLGNFIDQLTTTNPSPFEFLHPSVLCFVDCNFAGVTESMLHRFLMLFQNDIRELRLKMGSHLRSRISSKFLSTFPQLDSLSLFELASRDIGDETLAMFGANKQFQSLFLHNCQITARGIVDFIERWRSRESVYRFNSVNIAHSTTGLNKAAVIDQCIQQGIAVSDECIVTHCFDAHSCISIHQSPTCVTMLRMLSTS